jgi:AcrR family transcriptional regulator
MPRDTLTRDQIVRAAVELLDAEGIEAFSMRRLGAKLGSAATTVYWHVRNKDDLVVLAGDEVWAEISLPDSGKVGWRRAVETMTWDMFAMIVRHPWVVPATTSQLVTGPRMARFTDHAIGVFEAAGFRGADVDRAINVVTNHVLGTGLAEAATSAAAAKPATGDRAAAAKPATGDRAAAKPATGDRRAGPAWQTVDEAMTIAGSYPRLAAYLAQVPAIESDDARRERFAFGLETILDGLEARLAR